MSEQQGVDALVIEVTFNAYAQRPDGQVVGQNVANATIGFAIRTDSPPDAPSDAVVMAHLAGAVTPAIGAITSALLRMGYVALGEVKDPIHGHATPTGKSVVEYAPITLEAPGDTGRPS